MRWTGHMRINMIFYPNFISIFLTCYYRRKEWYWNLQFLNKSTAGLNYKVSVWRFCHVCFLRFRLMKNVRVKEINYFNLFMEFHYVLHDKTSLLAKIFQNAWKIIAATFLSIMMTERIYVVYKMPEKLRRATQLRNRYLLLENWDEKSFFQSWSTIFF